MSELPPRNRKDPSCGFCWGNRKFCDRDLVTGVCKLCLAFEQKQQSPFAPALFNSAAHYELFKGPAQSGQQTIDIQPASRDSTTLVIEVPATQDQVSRTYRLPIKGSHDSKDPTIIAVLDQMIKENFVSPWRGRDRTIHTIDNAVFIGGYLNLLSSISQYTVHVQQAYDGDPVEPIEGHCNVFEHFLYLLLCRTDELLEALLPVVRFKDTENMHPEYMNCAYGACAILRYEVCYFKYHLSKGSLSRLEKLPPGFKKLVLEWLDYLDLQIRQTLHHGCAKYKNWQESIEGSKKGSRRNGETITLHFTLLQKKFTIEAPPITSHFARWGDPTVCLVSSPTISMLEVPRILDIKEVVEQVASHVSVISSHRYDDINEASASPDLLLSDFSTLFTFQ